MFVLCCCRYIETGRCNTLRLISPYWIIYSFVPVGGALFLKINYAWLMEVIPARTFISRLLVIHYCEQSTRIWSQRSEKDQEARGPLTYALKIWFICNTFVSDDSLLYTWNRLVVDPYLLSTDSHGLLLWIVPYGYKGIKVIGPGYERIKVIDPKVGVE